MIYDNINIQENPPKEWFEYNELFASEYLPFWRVLEIADRIFDSYTFHNHKVLIQDGLVMVSVELEVEWAMPFKGSVGMASRALKKSGNRWNTVSAATDPSICLSVAMKNAIQKLCNLAGRKKDVPDESLEKKETEDNNNKFIN